MICDKEFLLKLDKQKHKTIYAKITALTLQEYPVETITGRVTQGSINLDGASAVRRTCSLTIVAQDFNYSNYLWGFNTKFKLEIGVENNIDSQYDNIIWFKQGIYVISSFNTSRSTNNFTITIQGKDKMSMLNGDLGGTVNSSVDFGVIEEEDQNGNWVIRKIPIREIIRNMVHQYGGEPLHNIIINDVPDSGYELLEYRYDIPMYLYRTKYMLNEKGEIQKDKADQPILNNAIYDNITLDGTIKCKVMVDNEVKETTLAELLPTDFEMLIDPLMGGGNKPSDIMIDDTTYIMTKIEYGQTAGYRSTPLTYAGDLIAKVGETITSVLDKIKNMLGEFEYFYDLDGHFIFQQKQSFVNTIYSPPSSEQENNSADEDWYSISKKRSEASQYFFNGGELTTTFNNNPNIANVRNDYSIWGQRNGISGAQIPVHLRYAIDNIPTQYTTVTVNCNIDENGEPKNKNDFQAIKDYNERYGTTLTGQEPTTYTIEQWDWREIIYQMALDYYKYNHLDDFELKVAAANPNLYPLGITGYEQYYIDLQGFWRDLYYPNAVEEVKSNYYDSTHKHKYWNKNVYEHPEVLNFWFDFLDTEGELSQFSVKAIGCRPKAINDTNIKAIYFKDTPNVLFIKDIAEADKFENGYKYIQAPGLDQMFSVSAQGKSAKVKLDELRYQHGYCAESVTINCIPIYYLQPNIRVHLFDEATNLDGDYIISKITIPLAYNGTMSLTATKAAETFF